jgi:toluene monooxygenase system protein E
MPSDPAPRRKTYTRLVTGRRVPTEYEVVSTDLHYNYPHRFELASDNPVVAWYEKYREGSELSASDWSVFADPRRTTYRAYTELQDRKEDVVDGLLRQVDETGSDERLAPGWIEFLHRWYAPLRFPVHGLQMLAAYIAQLAPGSRITNCAAFQAADEMRRLQRIAYRTAQLAAAGTTFDADEHRRSWEDDDAWQLLRELIERALVAYDWGEAFVATNLVIKPHLDRLVNGELAGTLATANRDPVLRSIHFSLDEDASWHRDWSRALVRSAIADRPENERVVRTWIERWRPLTEAAVGALALVAAQAPVTLDPAATTERVLAAARQDVADSFA